MSRSALDRLGKRLAASDQPTDDDLDLLFDVLTAYQSAAAEVQSRLASLGYRATSRTKTTGVLIDKLRRERSSLKSVQDIAGARIVSDGDCLQQDEVVVALVREFTLDGQPPRVKDRRAEPSAGYRAVHVVVIVQDLPVEIQVRTRLQDQWAQIVESLGDKWGRGIRYGQGPPDPQRELGPGLSLDRVGLWTSLQALTSRINDVELLQVRLSGMFAASGTSLERHEVAQASDAAMRQELDVLKVSLREAETSLYARLAVFRSLTERLD